MKFLSIPNHKSKDRTATKNSKAKITRLFNQHFLIPPTTHFDPTYKAFGLTTKAFSIGAFGILTSNAKFL